MLEQLELQAGAALALDGKTVRGSRDKEHRPIHLLSGIVHGVSAVVAQGAVESKTNEITQLKPLLKDMDLKDIVVTADALHTQRETARHLVEDRQANYVLTVKGNQPNLRKDIEDVFDSQRNEAERRHRAATALPHKERPEEDAFPPSALD